MFVIEPDDVKSLVEILSELHREIDAPFNLIFANTDRLWSDTTKAFVKRCDPDLILNYSGLEDDKLSKHFNTECHKPNSIYTIGRFASHLFTFTNTPNIIARYGDEGKQLETIAGIEVTDTAESLFIALNFGLLDDKTLKQLDTTIFEGIKRTEITSIEQAKPILFEGEQKFINITRTIGALAGHGHGSSIWEISYNGEGYFNRTGKKFIVSESDDIEAICYFWNTRSYYPYADLVWIPWEILQNYPDIMDDAAFIITLKASIRDTVLAQYPGKEVYIALELQFQGRNERWGIFEHDQTVTVSDSKLLVHHPALKSFSEIGVNGAFVLEMRGLSDFALPKRRSIGKLFMTDAQKVHSPMFDEQFVRICELGLSKYVLEVSPLHAKDITEDIDLPTSEQVVEHIFQDAGYTIQKTHKTSIFEQTINLMGGADGLEMLGNKAIYKIIERLTPKIRSEKISDKIIEANSNLPKEEVLSIIGNIRETGGISFPSITLTVNQMIDEVKISKGQKKEREDFLSSLQKLANQRILLRGKFFKCPHCSSNIWFTLEQIGRQNYCHECSNHIDIPLSISGEEATDHFRLNELLIRAVDQGQLATLVLANFLRMQRYSGFFFKSNLDVYKDGKRITDVDLFIKLWRRIGLAECKTFSTFTTSQVDSLISIAQELKVDFVILSTLISKEDAQISEIKQHIDKLLLEIPVFIITGESAFNPKINLIQKHFETNDNKFNTGAIML